MKLTRVIVITIAYASSIPWISAQDLETWYYPDFMECAATLLGAWGEFDTVVEYDMRGHCDVVGDWTLIDRDGPERLGSGENDIIGSFDVLIMSGTYVKENGHATEHVLASSGYRSGYTATWRCAKDPWLYGRSSNNRCTRLTFESSGYVTGEGAADGQIAVGPALQGALNHTEVQAMLDEQPDEEPEPFRAVILDIPPPSSHDLTGLWNTTMGRANLEQNWADIFGALTTEDGRVFLVRGLISGDNVELTLSANGTPTYLLEAAYSSFGRFAGRSRAFEGQGSGLSSTFVMTRPLATFPTEGLVVDRQGVHGVEEVSCDVTGNWVHTTDTIGESRWVISSNDGNRGNAVEEGLGGARGTARIGADGTLRIDWQHNGWAGTYSWALEDDCSQGTGQLVFTSGGTGTHASTVRRVN